MLRAQPSLRVCVQVCVCVSVFKVRACSRQQNDENPAGPEIVIYSVRFEFYLNTKTHVLFLAFRWGGPVSACITTQQTMPVAGWQLEHMLLRWLHGSGRRHELL